MRILLISEFFPAGRDLKFSGGVEARTFFVAKCLAKKHDVTVLTSRIEASQKNEKMFGFRVVRVGDARRYEAATGNIVSRIKFLADCVATGKKTQSDIVEGTNFITHLVAKQIASFQKIPVVFWYPDVWVGSWVKNAGILGIVGEILERINLFRGADSYIAISKQTEEKLKPFAKNNVHIIGCGVDLSEFQRKSSKFSTPTIICVSRLAEYKNIKTLILAFAYLTSKFKKINLIIVGTGPRKKSLLILIKALYLKDKVSFLSNLPRQELIKLYKSSHVFSLPSRVEGFGIATIEAAASGLPYVNSDTDIQKEITNNSKGGFLVNPDKPLMFAEKFTDLLTNKNLYRKKSEEAKTLAKGYNWEKISRQTEAVYKSLL
ncbi:MAG: Glycosyl transferase group 1 [Candidatus Curtissbacteria bacterium GW2011_GWA1_40_16]|uniref:Glycosyl transferase group 1 n=1 Tax=Candidatus Curtissbacteria bacterium GW2011_GWA1_40_16 TaxID=1618405 RepID=A0A0G0RID6_9BACT|nr:MAG: Glycosyl transferase group 1 [Candidatus Curtissbacteria bacterium GW2011_GWA1_40_16]